MCNPALAADRPAHHGIFWNPQIKEEDDEGEDQPKPGHPNQDLRHIYARSNVTQDSVRALIAMHKNLPDEVGHRSGRRQGGMRRGTRKLKPKRSCLRGGGRRECGDAGRRNVAPGNGSPE